MGGVFSGVRASVEQKVKTMNVVADGISVVSADIIKNRVSIKGRI